MNKKWIFGIGLLVIAYGLVLLAGELFHIDVWGFFFPLVLIALGVWLILRPRMLGSRGKVHTRILGDITRTGVWQVVPEELWLGIGDVLLDFTQAQVPEGETTLSIYGFIGDVRAYIPEGVGIKLISSAFINDVKMFEDKETSIFMPLDRSSNDYAACSRKVIIKTNHFIAGVKVRRPRK
jgi:predicted membrane protein